MNSEEEKKVIFDKGFIAEMHQRGCSQCVLIALRDKYNIPDDVFRSACGLAGGIGLTGKGTCGAFIGGAMVIGYLFGRSYEDRDDLLKLRNVCKYVRQLEDKFFSEYKTIDCANIQKQLMGKGGFRLYEQDELALFDKLGGHTNKCPSVVGKVAKWVVEVVEDIDEERK